MANPKQKFITPDGKEVDAIAPFIISASRATDIPAFYADWFMNRLGEDGKGYVIWNNPFNGKPYYVIFEKAKVFVFWTKNPKPMFKHLDKLDSLGFHYYFQFTLNDYEKEGFEPNVPSLEKRMETFRQLSERLGPDRVVWRFDPVIFTEDLTPRKLADRIFNMGEKIKGCTNRLVFSFIDIEPYKKVRKNLLKYSKALSSNYDQDSVCRLRASQDQIHEFCSYLKEFKEDWQKQGWNLSLATCAEKYDLEVYGITHSKCIDDQLILRLFGHDPEVADFMLPKDQKIDLFSNGSVSRSLTQGHIPVVTRLKKDPGQRKACLCVQSKDIGMYDTCVHGCIYCYANSSVEQAKQNLQLHKANPLAESILVSKKKTTEKE